MEAIRRVPLVEAQWALGRELIRSTKWGGFAMTTLWGCPTRKYHSWLSLWRGWERYELLPQMQEEVHVKEGRFLLTSQYFYESLAWEGYRHLEGLQVGSAWVWSYRLGEIAVQKTFYLSPEEPIWYLRYRFSGPVLFRWIPLWAVRPWHTLQQAPVEIIRKGETLSLPHDFILYFKVDPSPRFVPWPYPYEGAYYPEEERRGYPAGEVLSAHEVWEWRLHGAGEVSIGLSPAGPVRRFPSLPFPQQSAPSLRDKLTQASENFFLRTKEGEYILAGHPWFGVWGRDTFISLPGLTLARGEEARFHRIIETALRHLAPDGRLPNTFPDSYTAEDVGLWWVWALIQYVRMGGQPAEVWRRYGEPLQAVLVSYLHRLAGEDGLLRVSPFPAPSWMDAVVEGKPVVERRGALVELNALWYAALRFLAEIAPQEGVRWRWELLARRVLHHFKPTFWEKQKGYLADWRADDAVSWQIRPNQLFAAALPYRPVSDKIAELIIETMERHLLTPRGLRTLSPADPLYQGRYRGGPLERDRSYHNGTVWPWLLGSYVEAKLALWGSAARPALQKIWRGWEEALHQYGWGFPAEIYEGDAPHSPCGAPAQAWSVAELLRIAYLLGFL